MPPAGTKKLVIDGREAFVPEEDAQLAELILRGLAEEEDLDRAKERLAQTRLDVLHVLETRRNGRASLTVEGLLGGRVKVTWASEKKLDQGAVEALRETLPAGLHKQLFASETTWRLEKAYSRFMKVPQPAEVESLKGAIAACVTLKPKAAAVKFLAGDEEGGDDEE